MVLRSLLIGENKEDVESKRERPPMPPKSEVPTVFTGTADNPGGADPTKATGERRPGGKDCWDCTLGAGTTGPILKILSFDQLNVVLDPSPPWTGLFFGVNRGPLLEVNILPAENRDAAGGLGNNVDSARGGTG